MSLSNDWKKITDFGTAVFHDYQTAVASQARNRLRIGTLCSLRQATNASPRSFRRAAAFSTSYSALIWAMAMMACVGLVSCALT